MSLEKLFLMNAIYGPKRCIFFAKCTKHPLLVSIVQCKAILSIASSTIIILFMTHTPMNTAICGVTIVPNWNNKKAMVIQRAHTVLA